VRTRTASAAGRDRERTREAVGRDFIIIYRLSMLDLVPDGSDWVRRAAREGRRAAGATIINTGIGWHEARADDRRRCRAARSRGSRRR
jgi:2,4-dienoyl-CoA reductase-like NADH-dependent reductase (Old Yellow Enzyme family)